MDDRTRDPRRAALGRDAALARLRRATRVSVGVALALGGAFAALAAGSTHTKKSAAPTPVRHTARQPALTVAPVPPLVSAAGASSSGDDSSQASPAAAPAAPAPSYAPPVAVSGGS
jgi:hypothetical protein